MKVVNKSRKIIGIEGEALLPGCEIELKKELQEHPSIKDYLESGVLADIENKAVAPAEGISDLEKARIAEEAIAAYKAQQEEEAKKQAEKEAEIKAVKSMKKDELLNKAVALGVKVDDGDTAEVVRDKVLAALN